MHMSWPSGIHQTRRRIRPAKSFDAHAPHSSSTRRGFTLAESLVSIIIVSGAMVAALNAAGGAVVARQATSHTRVAQVLAESLMNEILDQDYEDLGGSPLFGLESGESGPDRTLFDDVDDYANYVESSLIEKDGTPKADAAGWSRCVTVKYVQPSDPDSTSVLDRGLKRVTVVVKRGEKEYARLDALKAAPHPDGLSIVAQ